MQAAFVGQEKREALLDNIAAFTYELSAKTQADLDEYTNRLNKRKAQYETADPAKALSFARSILGAQKANQSAEIGRATTQVLYGNATNRDKYAVLEKLHARAVESGDMASAQNIEQQAARLSVTIQNEDTARANAAAAAGEKAYGASKTNLKKEIQDAKDVIASAKRDLKLGNITAKEYYDGYTDKDGKKIFGVGALFATQKQLIERAASTPGLKPEDAAEFQKQASELVANEDYNKALNSRSYVQQYNQGSEPQAAYIGKDGLIAYRDKSVVADLNGKKIYAEADKLATKEAQANAKGGKLVARVYIGEGKGKQTLELDALSSVDNPFLKEFGTFYYAVNPLTGKTYIVDENGNGSKEVDMGNPESVARGVNSVLPKIQGGNFLTKFLNDTGGQQVANNIKGKTLSAADKFRAMGFNDLADQAKQLAGSSVSTNGIFTSGQTSLNDLSNKLNDLQFLATQRKAINDANAAANASVGPRVLEPLKPVTVDMSGKLNNVIGPLAVTPEIKKQQSTIGSASFNTTYNPYGKIYNKAFGK